MQEKYADQYIDELKNYFPEIEKEGAQRMIKSPTENCSYMRVWYRGFYYSIENFCKTAN
jgi:hypothetical protein